MVTRLVTGVVFVALAVSVAACRTEAPEPSESSTVASDESHEGHTMGRVFFVTPKSGQTVTSPVRFEFGSDQYQIAAVPEGEVTEARPDVGHFHLGLDSACLPTGMEIPKAEAGAAAGTAGSWIHFGTGSNNIEMSLTPGEHTLSVQVGDDLHRAVEGLCETITVNVQ